MRDKKSPAVFATEQSVLGKNVVVAEELATEPMLDTAT
jgi:hypothetical protein